MPSRLRGIVPYGLVLAFSLFLFWAATRIDVDTGGRISPSVWPKAIIVFMGLLCAYEIGKRLLAPASQEAKGLVSELQEAPDAARADAPAAPEPEHPRKLYAGIALVAAYSLAVPWLGFFLTTALFLGLFPWLGGYRNAALTAVLGTLGSLVLVVIFMRIAYISLPLGEGPFRTVSLALLKLIGVT
jgi:putative tricarboxylic transport membrane protein